MSKKYTNWFPHETNSANNRHLKAMRTVYGMEGYGCWWALQEILSSQPGYKLNISHEYAYNELADDMRMDAVYVERFITDCVKKFKLLECDENDVWCPYLMELLQPLEEKRAFLSECGKKGAAVTNAKKSARATKNDGVADLRPNENSAQYSTVQNSTEENSRAEEVEEYTTTPPAATTLQNANAMEYNTQNGTPLAYATLDDLKQRALADTIHFVPIHLRPGRIQQQAQLPLWLDAFNKWLRYGGEHVKNERDYRYHFNNWIQRQDMSQNPQHYDPLADKKPAVNHNKNKPLRGITPPPNPTIQDILNQNDEEAEYYKAMIAAQAKRLAK